MSGFPEFERCDGLGLAELVQQREITPDELLDAAIGRIEERNRTVNAVVACLYDQARAAIASGLPLGSFTGVPYLLTDLDILYAGAVTTQGSRLFAGLVADHDSELTTRLKRAGLVIIGKSNTSELGLATSTEPRLFGATRNPWDISYSAGGSSGGAAVSVAVGIVPMAHAMDGGGSIRIPAACCGLFGLKPTRPAPRWDQTPERLGAAWRSRTLSPGLSAIALHCWMRHRGLLLGIPIGRHHRTGRFW